MNQPMTAQDVRAWVNELRNGDDRVITAGQLLDLCKEVFKSIETNETVRSPVRALAEAMGELL